MKSLLEKVQDRLAAIRDKPLWILCCGHCGLRDTSRAPEKPPQCWRCRSSIKATRIPTGYLLISEDDRYYE